MEPWYKIAGPRPEVREGRSFNPDEFAIALEQVVSGTAPEDYRNPVKFFARTCFTHALREHAGLVLRRLAGETENTAPVLTLITQFGGGKTHTLTALYHIAKHGRDVQGMDEIQRLIKEAGLTALPEPRVAVFVGNAWDPRDGRETPWIDIARQLAGDAGVAALGAAARTTPPGTEALLRVFAAAQGPVLILMDEVLNFFNRHRSLAEPCYAFFDNLVRALTGVTFGAALISLPRSQVEMTEWDLAWQEKMTKVFRRVARDLIANDEAEISEVIRRRLFEDIGSENVRRAVAKAYADWCFERRAQLPPEWTAVDTATTEAKARELLRHRFMTCYPFHPATLTVFQRKWQTLPQYQQTRGTLAMFAQWVSWTFRDGYRHARREPLITLGSAPLEVPEFRTVILGQLGEPKLLFAIEADIAGGLSHARALDADTKGTLKDIHRRVATTILFESSGGMADKVAHLPELRFALGEPGVDTTSIDNAVDALERKAFYLRRAGTDGYRFGFRPTLKKVVNDRRASLDEDEVKAAVQAFVYKEFERGASLPLIPFPQDGDAVPDNPKLTLVVLDPDWEYNGDPGLREKVATWTRQRGSSSRLYPAALIWCVRKPGRELREKVELWLAWKRVGQEITDGTLGGDYERTERIEVSVRVREAEEAARDAVWAGYRFIMLADSREVDGLKMIDLGTGFAGSSETLCGRVVAALKAQGLLNEGVGAGYIERNWPPALRESGVWPLAGLRQSFLNGALTRLLDPDAVLRTRIVEFVGRGEFGLASGQNPDGTFTRVWFNEPVAPEEVAFEPGVFLLTRSRAVALKAPSAVNATPPVPCDTGQQPASVPSDTVQPEGEEPEQTPAGATEQLRIAGDIPPEVWNRLGTKLLPRLREGSNFRLGLNLTVTLDQRVAKILAAELKQVFIELGLGDRLKVELEDVRPED